MTNTERILKAWDEIGPKASSDDYLRVALKTLGSDIDWRPHSEAYYMLDQDGTPIDELAAQVIEWARERRDREEV